ncbi:MAG TPA: hypothetical protein VKV19_16150 [Ktedonobacteraceae bacterium]|nr:hypothetical protein [Ktedonobacteraceae bacterium]
MKQQVPFVGLSEDSERLLFEPMMDCFGHLAGSQQLVHLEGRPRIEKAAGSLFGSKAHPGLVAGQTGYLIDVSSAGVVTAIRL